MTLFTKIVRGEIPSYKCAENEEFYAFLDINPVTQGHTLVVPKREVDYFFDLTDEEIGRMMVFCKKVAAAIKSVFPCVKVGVAVMGLDVNHAHVHLAPLQSEIDMDFGKKKLSLSQDEMAAIASRILHAFESKA
ncbi:MAG: HIT family protein [Bacteroidaceae bacterium]|nr:HIT family protein [Bacteroidaceae bacterium]